MKKMRLHIYILLGLFLITFVLGSFFDLQLSEAIFSKNNTFGLIMSIVGTLIGYSCLAFCGGGLFGLALTKKYRTVVKVFLYIGAAVAFGLGVFFAGREFFGPNGFYYEDMKWLGHVITIPFMCVTGFLGFYVAKKSDNGYLLNVLLVLMVCIFMSLIPGVTLLKSVFHRPRFRTLSDPLFPEITFHNWWERCKNYKDLMSLYNLTSEEFKSFPSGHAGATLVTCMTLVFAPLYNEKLKKYHLVFFYSALVLTLLVCFARILVGAHFLSDVSMGAMLTTIFMFIGNEFVIAKMNKYEKRQEQLKEEAKEETAE